MPRWRGAVQSLLAFKEQHIDSTVAAQVIGTSGSDQSRVLYIDKGSSDGIRTDMAVITPNGIVGKIVQVFPDSAQVLPINDQLSGVGVMLENTRLQGILRGATNGSTTIQYVMADERVVPGEGVITSGGDRIFPKGLPVGKVVDVTPGKDLFLNIRVLPSAQLDHLEEVLVVTNITEQPPDVKDLGPIRASDILAQRLPTVPDNKAAVDAGGNAIATPGAAGSPATNAAGTAPNTAAGGSTTRDNAGSRCEPACRRIVNNSKSNHRRRRDRKYRDRYRRSASGKHGKAGGDEFRLERSRHRSRGEETDKHGPGRDWPIGYDTTIFVEPRNCRRQHWRCRQTETAQAA